MILTLIRTKPLPASWVGEVSSSYSKFLIYFAEDDSPYPEVRSAVANTDDPDIPVNTIRVWVLGLIFAIIIPVFSSHRVVMKKRFLIYSRVLINSSSSATPQYHCLE